MTRRSLFATLVWGVLVWHSLGSAPVDAQDRVASTGGDVVITPLVHASVQIEHAGKVIQIQEWVRRLEKDGVWQPATTRGLQTLKDGLAAVGIEVRLAEWYPSRDRLRD